MKRALIALIVGTVLSGLAAAYATTTQRMSEDPLPDLPTAERLVVD
jgi:hypothetical protein